jgi:cyclic pyranopterin monophosphate synthase
MNENKFSKGMFNVSNKPDTYREAVSLAILKVNPSTISLIKKGKSPKGDIIEAAKISATMAAKRTWDLIPYCHPIPIDQVLVEVFLRQDSIEIAVEVKSVWKTGVEMESLTGACIGALTIYDMLKPVDDTLSIGSVRLLSKSGGIKDFHEHGNKKIKAAVLVISDSVASGKRIDKSGKAIVDKLLKGGVEVIEYKILPDDIHLIEHHLKEFCDDSRADLILTSGGTGLGPRDVTPEATHKVLEKEVVGISETTRAYGQRRLPLSMLSRGLSGVRGKTLIINLPGSVRAVSESMDSLFPGILHAFRMLEGHGH